MNEISFQSGRICNLYCSGVLNSLFQEIDKLISEGRSVVEITGIASKLLDDLINNKSIVYVNNYHSIDELYPKILSQLNISGYCIICGSGSENIFKISKIHEKILEDDRMHIYEMFTNKQKIGNILKFNLLISRKDIMRN